MKFTLGVIVGAGAAWAALAIWQHRAIPDIDPDYVPGVDEMDDIVYRGRPPFDPAACVGMGGRH